MMQNGFRRIALAQGLLPERAPVREVAANVETADAAGVDFGPAFDTQASAWDRDPEMRVASTA